MTMNKEDFLTTSEFAKVCGVTKHTLFHYDDLGVLKPAMIDDKGYRFYAIKQLSTFVIIKVLKEMSIALKDIKIYLENQNTDTFIQIFQERSMQLSIEKKRIERTDKLIRNTLRMTTNALTNFFKPHITESEEEHLLVVDVTEETTEREKVLMLYSKYRFCVDKCLSLTIPTGSIVKKDDLLARNYNHSLFYFSVLNTFCTNSLIHRKPQGTYATILHKGTKSSINTSYDTLLHYIEEHGYRITSDAYETELLNDLATSEQNEHVVEISIKIEK